MRICPRVAPSDRRRPISCRRSSTEITMVLATPTPPTSSATAPSPRNRPLNAELAARLRGQRVRRAADLRPRPDARGLAVAASTARDRLDLARRRSARRRWSAWPSKPSVVGGDRPADQRGAVDLGGQRDRSQDADHREPAAADVDLRRRRRSMPSRSAATGRAPPPGTARWRRSATCRTRTVPPSGRSRSSAARLRPRCRRSSAGSIRSVRRTVAPVTVAGRRRRRHRADPARPSPPRSSGQRGAPAPTNVWPGRDGEHVGAERAELAGQLGPAGRADAHHGDHGGDADGDAERGERGAQRPAAQPGDADPATSRGASRRGRGSRIVLGHARRRVSMRPARRGSPAGRGSAAGDLPVVGDHHDRGAARVQLAQQRHDARAGGASRGCRSARRPAAAAGRRPRRGRSPPAAARRRTAACGRWSSRCPRPTRSSASAAAARRSPGGTPAVEQPVGDVVQRGTGAAAGRTAGRRSRSSWPAPRTAAGRAAGHVVAAISDPCRWSGGPGCPSGGAASTCPSRTARRSPPAPRRRRQGRVQGRGRRRGSPW